MKVMLMLVSFPQKLYFDANGQFRVFEMVLRGRGIPPIGAMGSLHGAFSVGCESGKQCF